MNNFTAFILGALLAVIVVGYVFFGAEKSSSDKTQATRNIYGVDAEKAPKPEEQAAPQPNAPETMRQQRLRQTAHLSQQMNKITSPAAPAPTQTDSPKPPANYNNYSTCSRA